MHVMQEATFASNEIEYRMQRERTLLQKLAEVTRAIGIHAISIPSLPHNTWCNLIAEGCELMLQNSMNQYHLHVLLNARFPCTTMDETWSESEIEDDGSLPDIDGDFFYDVD